MRWVHGLAAGCVSSLVVCFWVVLLRYDFTFGFSQTAVAVMLSLMQMYNPVWKVSQKNNLISSCVCIRLTAWFCRYLRLWKVKMGTTHNSRMDSRAAKIGSFVTSTRELHVSCLWNTDDISTGKKKKKKWTLAAEHEGAKTLTPTLGTDKPAFYAWVACSQLSGHLN